MNGQFPDARLKIKRAEKHIVDLQDLVSRFFDTDPYGIFVKDDPNGINKVELSNFGPPPVATALIIGDALHNTRSALDILIFSIARMRGCANPPRTVQFPVSKSENELETRVRGEIQRFIGSTISDLIINDLKPHKGGNGNPDLCDLHDLDIMDKHKLLIPVLSETVFTRLQSNNALIQKARFVVPQSSKLHIVSNPGKIDIADYEKPTLTIAFAEGQILQGKAVIPTLYQFAQLVSGIIDIIDGLDVANIK